MGRAAVEEADSAVQTTSGPLIILTAEDCRRLRQPLKDALDYGWLARGWVPPVALLELSDHVHRTAKYRPPAQVSGHAGTSELQDVEDPAGSETITVTEAANLTAYSSSYLRRLLRRGDLIGTRGQAGKWEVDVESLQSLIDNRTSRRTTKAA